jgi:hypothetical protein
LEPKTGLRGVWCGTEEMETREGEEDGEEDVLGKRKGKRMY